MHSPHALNHVSICYSPHSCQCILLMLEIMSPYAILHMVFMTFSPCLTSCLLMTSSTWFTLHAPHGLNHVPICYSPHGSHSILLMIEIISPYVILHIVGSASSLCLKSCLHMVFSTWFAWHAPHAWHHASICLSPHALKCIFLMVDIMAPYAFLHTVFIAFSSWLKSCLHMLFST